MLLSFLHTKSYKTPLFRGGKWKIFPGHSPRTPSFFRHHTNTPTSYATTGSVSERSNNQRLFNIGATPPVSSTQWTGGAHAAQCREINHFHYDQHVQKPLVTVTNRASLESPWMLLLESVQAGDRKNCSLTRRDHYFLETACEMVACWQGLNVKAFLMPSRTASSFVIGGLRGSTASSGSCCSEFINRCWRSWLLKREILSQCWIDGCRLFHRIIFRGKNPLKAMDFATRCKG